MDRRLAMRKKRSGDVARKRLKLLLTADKTEVPPETLLMLREDICRAVCKYMDIDSGEIEMRVGCREEAVNLSRVLYTVIPIKSPHVKGIF